MHSLELLPHRKPASLVPLPTMAHSCSLLQVASRPPSTLCPTWLIPVPGGGLSLIASWHLCALTLRWPIPVHGHALTGAVPAPQAGIPLTASPPRQILSAVMHSLGMPPHRQPASLFLASEMAHSCPRSCIRWGCSLSASRQPSSQSDIP